MKKLMYDIIAGPLYITIVSLKIILWHTQKK